MVQLDSGAGTDFIDRSRLCRRPDTSVVVDERTARRAAAARRPGREGFRQRHHDYPTGDIFNLQSELMSVAVYGLTIIFLYPLQVGAGGASVAGISNGLTSSASSSSLMARHWGPERSVPITRDPTKSLGISIVGGKVDVAAGSGAPISGIFIKNVLNDSPAGRTGQLRVRVSNFPTSLNSNK